MESYRNMVPAWFLNHIIFLHMIVNCISMRNKVPVKKKKRHLGCLIPKLNKSTLLRFEELRAKVKRAMTAVEGNKRSFQNRNRLKPFVEYNSFVNVRKIGAVAMTRPPPAPLLHPEAFPIRGSQS